MSLLSRIELDWLELCFCAGWSGLTTVAMLANSLSAVMGADWTRNLSRHRTSGAGSCLKACRRTARGQVQSKISMVKRTCHFKILTSLDATSIWSNAVPRSVRLGVGELRMREAYCLGAVVLTYPALVHLYRNTNVSHTLKATGTVFGFLIVRVCATSDVKGPNQVLSTKYPIFHAHRSRTSKV